MQFGYWCLNSLRTIARNIKVTQRYTIRRMSNSEKRVIGTHNGTFHCDEALACFMLRQLPEYKNADILRSRDNEELGEKCDIVVDVGGIFDHERKLYDHHQKDFDETFSKLKPKLNTNCTIRLSSAGLIFVYYGERVIQEILKREADITLDKDMQLIYIQMYRNFIQEIDAIDNGVPICPNGEDPMYSISTHLSARVAKLNVQWDETFDNNNNDDRFKEAMSLVGKEFVERVLYYAGPWLKARVYVEEALNSAKNVHKTGEIMILERMCPWKQHLFDLEKKYNIVGTLKLVIFYDDTWRVAGVPISANSFLGRKFLPEPWRGLRGKDLCEVAGLDDLIFVHSSGFIGGAKTKESAVAMAIKSVEFENV